MQTPRCIAVVPVDVGDPAAPLHCAALRELRRRPLLLWAVSALQSSGVPSEVVLAVPPAMEEAVAQLLSVSEVPGSEVPVRVLPVQADGPGHRLLAALGAGRVSGDPASADTGSGDPASGEDVVVVHDPLHPLSPPSLVRNVVRDLLAGPGRVGSIPVHGVTDTLKWVDEDHVVVGTADRESYRVVYSPQAYRRVALEDALSKAGDDVLRAHGCEVLPYLVRAVAGGLSLVPSGGEALRVAGEEDVVLAEALLQVGRTAQANE